MTAAARASTGGRARILFGALCLLAPATATASTVATMPGTGYCPAGLAFALGAAAGAAGAYAVYRLLSRPSPAGAEGGAPPQEHALLDASTGAREDVPYQAVADAACDWEYWRDAGGAFQYVSPSCERITGHPPGEFEEDAQLLLRLCHPDDRPALAAHLSHDFESSADAALDFRIVRDDGEVRWVAHRCSAIRSEDGTPLGRRASNRDVTERLAEHQRALQCARTARALLDAAPDFALLVDREGRFLAANQQVCDSLGKTEEELRGLESFALFDAEVERRRQKELERVVRTGAPAQFSESVQGRHYDHRTQPILDEDGEVASVAIYVRNVTGQVRSARAAAESSERYRLLYEAAPLGIFHSTLDGQFTDVNPALAAMLGYESPSDVLANVEDIAKQIYLEPGRRRHIIETVKAREGFALFENEYRRSNGERWYAHLYLRVVRDVTGQPAYLEGIVDDMTEAVEAARRIRESEAYYRAIARSVPSGAVFLYDKELRFLIAEGSELAAAGYTREHYEGRRLPECHDPETVAVLQAHYEKALAGETSKGEFDFGDQTYRIHTGPVLTDAGKAAGVAVVQNITDLRRAEARVVETSHYLEAVLQAVPEMVLVAGPNGDVLYAGEVTAQRLELEPGGGSAGMLLDRTLAPFEFRDVEGRSLETAELPVSRALRGEAVSGEVIEVLREGRHVRWYISNAVPVRDASGAVRFAVVTASDISEVKRLDDERLEVEGRVLRAQKQESLATLAGGVAHHFNNLLHSILGFADMALEDLPEEMEPVRRSLGEVIEAAQRAASLSQKLLAASGHGHFQMERLDLRELLSVNRGLLEGCLGPGCELVYHLEEDCCPIRGDACQIRQVVTLLAQNAAEAIEAADGESGGPAVVAVGLGERWCDTDYLSSCYGEPELPEGSYVYLDVTDNGCGIEPGVMAKIFDPFFSTKLTGRGLGLTAVQGVVRGHGGAIRVQSIEGGGACFRLLFPALALVEALGPPRTDATWQAQGKALLIDDDRMVLVVGRRLLKRLGFEVVTAGTAEAALRAVRGADEDFAVILMDWRMPGTDPLATLTTLRQEAPSTPVVLCSGYNESYLNARLGSVRPAGIIQKPFRADELREAVRDAVERPGSR